MKEKRTLIPLLRWVQQNPGCKFSKIKQDVQRLPWEERRESSAPSVDCIKWRLLYLEALGYVYEDSQGWQPSPDLEERLAQIERSQNEQMKRWLEGPRPSEDIDCLEMTFRVRKRLDQQGIQSVTELREKLEGGTLDSNGLGKKSMEEIRDRLDWHATELAKSS